MLFKHRLGRIIDFELVCGQKANQTQLISCDKWGLPNCELVHHNSKAPEISFLRIWSLLCNLWRKIHRRSFEAGQTLRRALTSKAEITKFANAIAQQNVCWLQVAMRNVVLVQVT